MVNNIDSYMTQLTNRKRGSKLTESEINREILQQIAKTFRLLQGKTLKVFTIKLEKLKEIDTFLYSSKLPIKPKDQLPH